MEENSVAIASPSVINTKLLSRNAIRMTFDYYVYFYKR